MHDCCNGKEFEATIIEHLEHCCDTPHKDAIAAATCPACGEEGKLMDLLSVKSMLVPKALAELDVHQAYRFCKSPNCNIVYFGSQGMQFTTDDVRVAVFQKDPGDNVNVCYCFGWTRAKIADEIRLSGESTAISSITKLIQAGRCACEIKNPQGSCCLGNVAATIKEIKLGARQ